MKQLLITVFALVAILVVGPGWVVAQEDADVSSTRLLLSETATREAEQDTLAAALVARAENLEPGPAQSAVNAAMAEALARVEESPSVRGVTGSYWVQERRGRDGVRIAWVAEQELRLRSGDAAELLDLTGRLQDQGLILRSLAYELSREARQELEDQLVLEAIARLRTRADVIAGALDLQLERFDTVSIGGSGGPVPRPFLDTRMAAAAEAMPPPMATPDLEAVSVTVDAEVFLGPRS